MPSQTENHNGYSPGYANTYASSMTGSPSNQSGYSLPGSATTTSPSNAQQVHYPAPGSMIPPGSVVPPLQPQNFATAVPVAPAYPPQWSSAAPAPSLSPQKKKRPGPKRDAKPAPSEKLERNRQAQRSHRERKEMYTKELEREVQRLKELFVDASSERDRACLERDHALVERHRLMEEVRSLRNQISTTPATSNLSVGDAYSISDAPRNGSFSHPQASLENTPAREMSFEGVGGIGAPPTAAYRENPLERFDSSGFASDQPTQQHTLSPASTSERHPGRALSTPGTFGTPTAPNACPPINIHMPAPAGIDYDELALDFVLTLERPCMTHAQYLMVRAHNKESQNHETGDALAIPDEVPRDDENQHISGHTLMATVPSHSHVMGHPNDLAELKFPEGIQRKDLLKLLGLTSQLDISDQELPPVKAWLRVLQNPRYREMTVDDFAVLKERLLGKVQCHRFGAIITEEDIVATVEEILEMKNRNAVENLEAMQV